MRCAAAVLALFAVTGVASAADPQAGEKEFVTRVNAAIEKGKRYLIQQQNADGTWEGILLESMSGQEGGQTALVSLALLTAGVSPDDRVMQKPLDFLRRLPHNKTYVVGLSTMVLAEAKQAKDLGRIQQNVTWLLDNAVKANGRIIGWNYPSLPNNTGTADGSNTQYALLGLYAGKLAGANIPADVWPQLLELYTKSQDGEKDNPGVGFWRYFFNRGDGTIQNGPSFTMTAAGVSGLLIAKMGMNVSPQKLDEVTGVAANCGNDDTQDSIDRGMNWIAARFSFESAQGAKSSFYNTYGIERLGRLSGKRFIGRFDWYREGCEYLLASQLPDTGEWSRKGNFADNRPAIATSFSLLFLSKGRTPVLVTKLAYGKHAGGASGPLVEQGDDPGKVGWNRKPNDARNLVEFASKEMFPGLTLGWQVYDPRRANFTPTQILAEVGSLLASPVVYMNGHKAPLLSGQQKEILKRYIEEGGFLFAEACCGSPEFAAGFADLMQELFPENTLTDLPPEHAIWRAFYAVSPAEFKGVKCLERGCKTVVVFSPTPLAGFWEESRFMPKPGADANTRGECAFRLAGNVIAYATGLQPPDQKGTVVRVVDLGKKDLSPPRGAFVPAQLRLPGEAAPAPAAMRNLMAHVKAVHQLDAVADKKTIGPGDPELFKYKFVYAHGRKRAEFTPAEVENLKLNLESGGLLFADACCGKPEFDAAFRALVAKMYPGQKLEAVPADDELYSEKLNGVAIRTVKRREKADGNAPGAGFRDLPPALEGVKIDGRWAILYSKYDVGCALEGHKSTDCLGHTKESALQLASAAVLYALKR